MPGFFVGIMEELRVGVSFGEFKKTINQSIRTELFAQNNGELLGPALRRANLFYQFRNLIICMYEFGGNWFVIGDAFYRATSDTKSDNIDREAAFQTLFHYSAQGSKNLLGYYLHRPLLFPELRCNKLGLVHEQGLLHSYDVGEGGDEFRRAKNLEIRSNEITFVESYYKDLDDGVKKIVRDTYRKFIQKKRRPYIGFILARPSDVIEPDEFFFISFREGEAIAIVSGFFVGSSFCVDRLARITDTRMILDILLSRLTRLMEDRGLTTVNLGLSSFFGEPEDIWAKLRKLVRFWYDADSLRAFKKKYSDREIPAYYFVEKRKNHIWQFIKLAVVSTYWKMKH